MLDKNNEVLFGEYCKTCKYKNYSETDSPCAECLAEPVNLYSHKPVKWEGADGIYAGPPPRPDHAYQRAVKYVPENRKDREKAIARQNIDAEYTGNKVQTINDKVTDDQYPSATAVKKALEGANEVTAQSLARKIDAPNNCERGEFLAVEEVNEDGVVTKVKGAKVQTEPPDLSENDPTKPGYVKNRTHYDSRVIKTIEKTFENITEFKFVKLADADIDINRIVSYSMSETDGENTYNFIATDILIDDISEMLDKPTGSVFDIRSNDGRGPIINYFAVPFEMPNQSDDGSDATVTYHGLYGGVDAGYILVKFEVNIESGELKTIDPKYIHDMYYSEIELLTEFTWTFDQSIDSIQTINKNIELIAGNKYIVSIDGDEYIVTAAVVQTGRYDYSICIGRYVNGFANAPFVIYVPCGGETDTTGSGNIKASFDSALGARIKLYKVNALRTIDEKYFPKTIFSEKNAPVKFGEGALSSIQGANTTASGNNSHAEGDHTTASGDNSHAEGRYTTASEDNSHAEGSYTTASGFQSHTEGSATTASGYDSHAEGWGSTASGNNSHAEGHHTTASRESQHVQGEYNVIDTVGKPTTRGAYADIVGNGTSDTKRSNAYTLDWDGNAWFAGNVYVGSKSGTNKDDGSVRLATVYELSGCYKVNVFPDVNNAGTYISSLSPLDIVSGGFDGVIDGNDSLTCVLFAPKTGTAFLPLAKVLKTPSSDNALTLIVEFSANVSGENVSVRMQSTVTNGDNGPEESDVSVTVTRNKAIPAPTTAAVGQILKVKTVDAAGKPTEWEAAELSLGFGSDGKLYIMISGTPYGSGVEINGTVTPTDGEGNSGLSDGFRVSENARIFKEVKDDAK